MVATKKILEKTTALVLGQGGIGGYPDILMIKNGTMTCLVNMMYINPVHFFADFGNQVQDLYTSYSPNMFGDYQPENERFFFRKKRDIAKGKYKVGAPNRSV